MGWGWALPVLCPQLLECGSHKATQGDTIPMSHRITPTEESCWTLSFSLTIFSLPAVDYLECDLGQTEFTPPGCVALLNITEPLLGMLLHVSLMSQAYKI